VRIRTVLVLASLSASLVGLSLVGSPAQAGPPLPPLGLRIQDQDVVDVPTFSFEVLGDDCLSDTEVTVEGFSGVQVTLDDANNGTFALPGAPAGDYEVTVSCTTVAGPSSGDDFVDFGYVTVDKVVVGEVPAGTEFVVDITCEGNVTEAYGGTEGFEEYPFLDTTLTFGAAGGTRTVVHYGGQDCVIEETETGGAEAVTVDTEDCGEPLLPKSPTEATSGSFGTFAPVACTQTVTNEFGPADVAPDVVGPVDASPAFTG
jgi:hypothetical protein